MAFPEFGKWCNCTGYLTKDKNGIQIITYPIEYERDVYRHEYDEVYVRVPNSSGKGYNDTPIDWEEPVEKALRKIVEKCFSGIIVGKQKVTIKENLIVRHWYEPYCGEYDYVDKEPTEQIDCYIVFFANNRKRFVPVKMAEIITEDKQNE